MDVVGAVGITIVLNVVLGLLGKQLTLTPMFCFASAVAYALVLRTVVEAVGARRWLIELSLALDLTASVATFVLVNAFGSPEQRAEGPAFASHILGASTGLILMLNALRGDAVASVVGSVMASACMLNRPCPRSKGSSHLESRWRSFSIMGGVGVAAARQGRRTLDNFARLQLLRRYLSPAAVERVMRKHPDAALSLGGRLLTVTLLSADLRGFTAMSESLSPNEVVRQLNEFHGAMLEQIEANGGVLDKFIGDGVLVVFGLERATEQGEKDADEGDAGAGRGVDCARAMLSALTTLNEARVARGEPALRMASGSIRVPWSRGTLGHRGAGSSSRSSATRSTRPQGWRG